MKRLAPILLLAACGPSEERVAWDTCTRAVSDSLLSPGSAQFSPYSDSVAHALRDTVTNEFKGWGAFGWVDSQDRTGVLRRTHFTCILTPDRSPSFVFLREQGGNLLEPSAR